MARRFWPDSDPIGYKIRPQFTRQRYFWIPESRNLPLTIVGVVGDIRHGGLAENNLPQLYLPYLQNPSSIMNLLVRTKSEPLQLGQCREESSLGCVAMLRRNKTMADQSGVVGCRAVPWK